MKIIWNALLIYFCVCIAIILLVKLGEKQKSQSMKNVVATYDGHKITKNDVQYLKDQLYKIQLASPSPVHLDKPEYVQCRKDLKKYFSGKQTKVSDKELLKDCKSRNEAFNRDAFTASLTQLWIKNIADKLKVTVSEKEVEEAFKNQKKTVFPSDTENKYKQFLGKGISEKTLKARLKTNLLVQKSTVKAAGKIDEPNEKQIQSFYDYNVKNKVIPKNVTLNEIRSQLIEKMKQQKMQMLSQTKMQKLWDEEKKKTSCSKEMFDKNVCAKKLVVK